MAQDTFKRTAPTIEFFKDGETIRAKKLGKMITKIQDGMASLEAAVGDIHNRAVTFEASTLFQNSIGRSIGQMDQTTIFPIRQFDVVQKTKQSLHQGLIRWPHSNAAAATAGNLSANLLPMARQEDKTGIGCIRDDGTQCTAGYQSIYNQEKNLVANGLFEESLALSGWDVTDATIKTGGGAQMDVAFRYNLLKYSENFEFWTLTDVTAVERISEPDPNGQNATYKIVPDSFADGPVLVELAGSGTITSSNWCFSIWMAASGERTSYISISGAETTDRSLLKGSAEGGIVYNWYIADEYSQWAIPLSGVTWKRFYVHANFPAPVAASAMVAQVAFNISGQANTTPTYLFGAQLEPTNYPTTYRRTQGSTTSGLGSEVSVGYNLSVIPGHTYQVTATGSGTIELRLDGSNLFTLSPTVTSDNATFTATADTVVVDAYVSGAAASSNFLTLFRVDPGTPCHAMNCPGLSAYDKIRSYRAVLPALTVSGHQYFARRLQLPDEFQQALYSELPGNILGVFDHELNHAVPDQIVDWKLSNWPIGGLDLGGLLGDPEFLSDWTTVGADTYPTELVPITGSGEITRDVAITTVVSTDTLPDAPSPYLHFTDATQHLTAPNPTLVSGWLIPAATDVTIELLLSIPSGVPSLYGAPIINHGGGTRFTFKTYLYSGILQSFQTNTFYDGSISTPAATVDIRDGAWHHYAITITDSPRVIRHFLDGVDMGSSAAGTAWDMFTGAGYGGELTDDLQVGADGITTGISGMSIAGILIRRGAIYTANFTAPKASLIPSGVGNALSGILLYTPMQEGSGQYCYDVGPSGYNFRLGGAAVPGSDDPIWVTSGSRIYTEHYQNVGVNEAYSCSPVGANDYAWNQSFTMEGWFRAGDGVTSGASNAIAFQRSFNTGGNLYTNYLLGLNAGKWYAHVQTVGAGGAVYRVRAGNTTVVGQESANSVISDDGLWHHVAFTITKNSGLYNPMKLFVDGTLVASGQSEFQTNWDYRIPQGETDVWNLAAPSGIIVLLGDTVGSNIAIDEIVVTSGTKYTGSFTPNQPIINTEPLTNVILAHLRINEGMGTTLYNSGPTFQKPLELMTISSYTQTGGVVTPDWRWRSDDFFTTITYTGTPIDRFTVSVSGNSQKGVVHTFPLSVGQVYTLDYRVRANISYSGIFENFVVASGAAEVDLLLDSNYQDADGVQNLYKVSTTEPGITSWSEPAPGGFWSIRRRLRATEEGTLVNITVGVSGNISAQSATFDALDVNAQVSNSTIFKYQADPVLGLNWEGTAEHVIEENLFPWSTHIEFGNYNDLENSRFEFNVADPSGLPTAIKISGYVFGHEWDAPAYADAFVDNEITFQWWARSNNPAMSNYTAYLDFNLGGTDTFEYEVTEEWQQFSHTFTKNVAANTYAYFENYMQDPGFEVEIAWFSVHNGSGLVDYVPTNGQLIRNYRRVLRVDQYRQLGDWTALYGLVGGFPIQTALIADSYQGLIFETDNSTEDFPNFPASGIIRVAGQEFGYRGKQADGKFIDCVPGWRGTVLDDTVLTSGTTVTYVPLPRAIDRIDGDLVYFKEDLPAANGDWANQVHLQLYNVQVSNLSRFSLTASAVPLTKAAGTLMTAFMQHVSDDARHFRRDQLCAALVDPSIYAGFEDMEVRLNVVAAEIEEVNQPARLEIFAFGFMNPNNKEITISWGDGNTDVITGTGQYFDSIEHTYDLGDRTRPQQHTITVEVRDLDLLVTRSSNVRIIVDPVSKGSQTVRAVIITQPTATSQARTAIWAQTSGLQQARTYLI